MTTSLLASVVTVSPDWIGSFGPAFLDTLSGLVTVTVPDIWSTDPELAAHTAPARKNRDDRVAIFVI
jgi:hypothetical protein